MLKKKLTKSQFLGHGLLLLVPNSALLNSNPGQFSKSAQHAAANLGNRKMIKDTAILADMQPIEAVYTESVTTSEPPPRVELNHNAVHFVSKFMRRESEELTGVRLHAAASFQTIEKVFSRYGIPAELKYLAVIESYLNNNATSRVGAKGMWQLMPQTAREHGLKVTRRIDERTNTYKSTVAAAKYIKELYAQFGDWLLVVAAYNSGPGAILKAIHHSGSHNFWALQNYLPAESRAHVKRFIGTHYFFENNGSMATLTKSETAAYHQTLDAYRSRQKDVQSKDSLVATAQ
jgi:membrane-bound lytic murein transglycosylase D